MKEIKYDVLSASNRKSLVEIVERFISEGWMPLGSPVFGEEDDTDFIWHQAMIREK